MNQFARVLFVFLLASSLVIAQNSELFARLRHLRLWRPSTIWLRLIRAPQRLRLLRHGSRLTQPPRSYLRKDQAAQTRESWD